MPSLATLPVPPPAPTTPDPVLAALERIEQRLAAVEQFVGAFTPVSGLVTTLPGAVAMVADTFDRIAGELGDAGVDLDERVRSAIRALEVSTAPRAVNGLASLVESKLLEPSALAVVSQLADAMAEPGEARPVGIWGTMRALRDPDVQRALGFVIAIARKFGQNLGAGAIDACRDRLDDATTHLLEAP